MANRNSDEEKTVPLSIVFMTLGLIIVGAAVVVWVLLPKNSQTLPALLQAAMLPTPEPTTDPQIFLLPETPEATALPAHFVSAADYVSTGNVGQPQRLVIPVIGLDAPVSTIGLSPVEIDGETFYQWQVPQDYRAGWHNTSARLGQLGNTVLNGHHNIAGEVFRDLIELEEGNEVIIYDGDQEYTYQVSQIELLPERGQPAEVRQENARWILPTDDERITLVTCWPYEDNSHRLVVVAKPATDIASNNE